MNTEFSSEQIISKVNQLHIETGNGEVQSVQPGYFQVQALNLTLTLTLTLT